MRSKLFNESCSKGDCANSFFELSLMHENGVGCEANSERSADLKKKATMMGDENCVLEKFFSDLGGFFDSD